MCGRGSQTAPSCVHPGVRLSRTRRATRRWALASKCRRWAPAAEDHRPGDGRKATRVASQRTAGAAAAADPPCPARGPILVRPGIAVLDARHRCYPTGFSSRATAAQGTSEVSNEASFPHGGRSARPRPHLSSSPRAAATTRPTTPPPPTTTAPSAAPTAPPPPSPTLPGQASCSRIGLGTFNSNCPRSGPHHQDAGGAGDRPGPPAEAGHLRGPPAGHRG